VKRILIKLNKFQWESLTQFLYDLSKLCFAGVLVEGWLKDSTGTSGDNRIKAFAALLLGIVFLIVALFIERNKEGRP